MTSKVFLVMLDLSQVICPNLLICCKYENCNAQGAFVIIFFVYSDETASVISTKKIHTLSSHFSYFDVFPVRAPQKCQVQARISKLWPVFPDYLSVS